MVGVPDSHLRTGPNSNASQHDRPSTTSTRLHAQEGRQDHKKEEKRNKKKLTNKKENKKGDVAHKKEDKTGDKERQEGRQGTMTNMTGQAEGLPMQLAQPSPPTVGSTSFHSFPPSRLHSTALAAWKTRPTQPQPGNGSWITYGNHPPSDGHISTTF